MLNKVRNELMAQDGQPPLSGEVEADETFIGGKPRESYRREVARKGWNMQTAYWDRKAIVFAAVERGGRIRADVIPNSRQRTRDAKVREFVIPSSILYTDDFKAYKGIGARGRLHTPPDQSLRPRLRDGRRSHPDHRGVLRALQKRRAWNPPRDLAPLASGVRERRGLEVERSPRRRGDVPAVA
jgi:transposase-like protein